MGYKLKTPRGYYFGNMIAILFTDKEESAFIFEKKEYANEVIAELNELNIECELIVIGL